MALTCCELLCVVLGQASHDLASSLGRPCRTDASAASAASAASVLARWLFEERLAAETLCWAMVLKVSKLFRFGSGSNHVRARPARISDSGASGGVLALGPNSAADSFT